MPCDTRRREQTAEERRREVNRALDALQAEIGNGRVQIRIGAEGAVCFEGWRTEDRQGVTDVCAYRLMVQRDSWEFRQAMAQAESMAGRQVSQQAISSGLHSHDGGATWSRH